MKESIMLIDLKRPDFLPTGWTYILRTIDSKYEFRVRHISEDYAIMEVHKLTEEVDSK